jgi:Fur family ferric uptake transcriptional regulator
MPWRSNPPKHSPRSSTCYYLFFISSGRPTRTIACQLWPSKGEGFYSARRRRSATSDVDRGMISIKWKASAPRIDAGSRSRSACLKSLALELQLFCLLVSQFHRIAGYNCNSFATGFPVSATTAMDYQDRTEEAKRLVPSAGARLTRPHASVLSVLFAADRALTHQDIVDALFDTHAMDRVTVYRVLEWPSTQGLSHRIEQADRVWRFSVSVTNPHSEQTGANSRHAHFIRSQCGHTFCLAGVPVRLSAKLPAGYRSQTIELRIRGLCGASSPEQASR